MPEEPKGAVTVRRWDWGRDLKNGQALNRRKRARRTSHKDVVWSKRENFALAGWLI